MRIKHIIYGMMAMAALLVTACDDKSDCGYEPAAPTADNCIGVYFNSSNPSEFIFQPGEAAEVELTLSRQASSEAADVPLTVSADEAVAFPATAHFEAGASTTTVKAKVGQLEESKKYNFTLSIPDAYADHYTITDGTTFFKGFVMVAAWRSISDNVRMSWTTLGVTNQFVTSIEQLGSFNRYRFRNLVNSGIDYVFTVGNASTAYPGYSCITTYSNYEPYEGAEAKGAYLFDDATQSYPAWTVADGSIEVADICVLEDYGSTLGYSCISFDKCSGYVYLYFTDYTDGQYEYYNPISFSWKEKD